MFKETVPETYEFDYGNADRIKPFKGTHPQVMQKRIETTRWNIDFSNKPLQRNYTFRRRLLQLIMDLTGWSPGEYQNYKIVKRHK